jgi:hypothetical protein
LVLAPFELDLEEDEMGALADLRADGVLPGTIPDEEMPVAAAMQWFIQHAVLPSGAGTQFILDD